MSHHGKHLDPHEKKKAQQKKNRHNQEIFNAVRIHQDISDQIRDETEARQVSSSAPAGGGDTVWSDKVASIRNRLTGQKRTSKERWNRFAGTSGGGGRGL